MESDDGAQKLTKQTPEILSSFTKVMSSSLTIRTNVSIITEGSENISSVILTSQC